MRRFLHARVRPLVERFANQLTELALARAEAELKRVEESLEVALSAYQSDDAPDLTAAAIGTDVAGMLDLGNRQALELELEPRQPRIREYKPETYPPSRRAREDRAEPQANGKKPITCKTCGFVGGNARGCGTAHVTRPLTVPRDTFGNAISSRPGHHAAGPVPDPMAAITARPQRPPPFDVAASKARIARIAARAKTTPPSAREPEPAHDTTDDDESERWSPQRIAKERELAESSKHAGELPVPRSSFRLTPPRNGRVFDCHDEPGEVEELNFEGPA